MSKKLAELLEERNRLVKQSREVLDKAETEKRALTTEETTTYDAMFGRIDELRQTIEREQRQIAAEKETADDLLKREKPKAPETGDDGPAAKRAAVFSSPEYRSAFQRYLRGDRSAPDELRALQVDADTGGGFLQASEVFVNDLIKGVDNIVYLRGKATKFLVPEATKLGAPSLDADPADADWTSEIATGSEDSTMAFGRRELTPHPLAKRIKISNKLLRVSMSIEDLVRSRLEYKFGVTQEKGFMTGSGVGQPLGVFTASSDGVSTSRDVSSGNTTTEIRFDGLIATKYSLKGQYWSTAEWIFHRDAMKQISLLKDGEGQYIWRESTRVGEPDLLLGRPINMSEYAPNTFTTGLYVGLLGDFKWYWIADSLAFTVQRLIELYAETNQTGYIGRLETDGMPVLAEAFARVKLA